MTEIWFYHLESRSWEEALPELLERTLARGWRAVIRTDSSDRAQAVDALLWTFDEETFLPHAQEGDGDAAAQPILITVRSGNPNGAEVLFLIGGATPDDWKEETYSRIVILFDGRDESAVSAARSAWKAVKDLKHDVAYWRQSSQGKWEKQA